MGDKPIRGGPSVGGPPRPESPRDEPDQGREIDWYRSDDLILGFCGPVGAGGVYRCWLGGRRRWEFCPAGTEAWDWYHQKAYRQHKADPFAFDDLKDRLPPLPVGFPPPADCHVADPPEPDTANARRGGPVFERVLSAPGGRLPVYVVLFEDLYESALGDGIFRYFEAAYTDEAAARRHIEAGAGEAFRARHLREVFLTISVDDVVLDTEGCELSPFDNFRRQQICDDLAGRLP